jgi:hypothetical protein
VHTRARSRTRRLAAAAAHARLRASLLSLAVTCAANAQHAAASSLCASLADQACAERGGRSKRSSLLAWWRHTRPRLWGDRHAMQRACRRHALVRWLSRHRADAPTRLISAACGLLLVLASATRRWMVSARRARRLRFVGALEFLHALPIARPKLAQSRTSLLREALGRLDSYRVDPTGELGARALVGSSWRRLRSRCVPPRARLKPTPRGDAAAKQQQQRRQQPGEERQQHTPRGLDGNSSADVGAFGLGEPHSAALRAEAELVAAKRQLWFERRRERRALASGWARWARRAQRMGWLAAELRHERHLSQWLGEQRRAALACTLERWRVRAAAERGLRRRCGPADMRGLVWT